MIIILRVHILYYMGHVQKVCGTEHLPLNLMLWMMMMSGMLYSQGLTLLRGYTISLAACVPKFSFIFKCRDCPHTFISILVA